MGRADAINPEVIPSTYLLPNRHTSVTSFDIFVWLKIFLFSRFVQIQFIRNFSPLAVDSGMGNVRFWNRPCSHQSKHHIRSVIRSSKGYRTSQSVWMGGTLRISRPRLVCWLDIFLHICYTFFLTFFNIWLISGLWFSSNSK